jgi:erythritol transport system permease protein
VSTTTTTPAPPGAPAADEKSGRSRFNMNTLLVEGRALIALIIIIAIFAILSDNYLTAGNLTTITKQVAFNAIVALGMLLVILNGGIDLSVGSIVGFTAAEAFTYPVPT